MTFEIFAGDENLKMEFSHQFTVYCRGGKKIEKN